MVSLPLSLFIRRLRISGDSSLKVSPVCDVRLFCAIISSKMHTNFIFILMGMGK